MLFRSMLAGRSEDRLLFDHQRSIATLLGFEGEDAKTSIESFMQQYYRVVMSIAQLSDLIIQHFEEVILAHEDEAPPQPINARFQLHDGYIEARNDNAAALKWLAEFHNPYQLDIRDEDGNLGLNLGVYGAPETFFIDAKGVIRDKYVGVIDEVVWREQLAAKYQTLVDEAKP